MAITVLLPNALRPYAAGNDRVPLDAQTAGEALQKLVERYPDLAGHLPDLAGNGQGIYRNGVLLGKLQGLETALGQGDRLTLIVPEGNL
jgi:molybdopterin converting factor small subunit